MPDPVRHPLSPHLSVYRPEITSVLSILHRFAGLILGLAMVALAAFLAAAAAGPEAFAATVSLFSTVPGYVFLAAVSAAFFYHLANGVRHLFWDAGYGFELRNVRRSGWFVVAFTAAFTAAFWYGVGLT